MMFVSLFIRFQGFHVLSNHERDLLKSRLFFTAAVVRLKKVCVMYITLCTQTIRRDRVSDPITNQSHIAILGSSLQSVPGSFICILDGINTAETLLVFILAIFAKQPNNNHATQAKRKGTEEGR